MSRTVLTRRRVRWPPSTTTGSTTRTRPAMPPWRGTEVDPLEADVSDGKWYPYTTTPAPRGTDYTFDFTATDATKLAATDWPAPPADAPDVLNRPPPADAGLGRPGAFLRGRVLPDRT